jgi:hypothetical protein
VCWSISKVIINISVVGHASVIYFHGG